MLGGEEKDGYCASCRSTAAPVSKRSFCIREGVVIAVGLGLVHDSVCVWIVWLFPLSLPSAIYNVDACLDCTEAGSPGVLVLTK